MIVLLRMRSLTIFALFVLSLSFIYIGYNGLSIKGDIAKEELRSSKEPVVEVVVTTEGLINNNDIIKDITGNNDNYIIEFRMKRDKVKNAQLETLKENINNPYTSEELRNIAQKKLFEISDSLAKEVKAENLLKAKVYLDRSE